MDNKIFIYFILLHSFMTHTTGTIIMLHGTGSSGKTSISKTLQEILPNAASTSIDDFVLPEMLQNGLKLDLITTNMTYKEKLQVVIDHRRELSADLKPIQLAERLYVHTKKLAHDHDFVIIDTVFGSDLTGYRRFKNTMNDFTTLSVLVYCSPLHIAEHVIKRNSGSNLEQHRNIVSHVQYFTKLYRISNDAENTIDTITKQEITRLINVMQTYFEKTGMKRSLIKKNIAKTEELYLQKMLKTKQSVIIQSPVPYDIMVNTGKLSVKQCVDLICEKLMQPQN